jgi:hypothetical protein
MCCINNPATRCCLTQARAKEIPIFIFRRHCSIDPVSAQPSAEATEHGRARFCNYTNITLLQHPELAVDATQCYRVEDSKAHIDRDKVWSKQ